MKFFTEHPASVGESYFEHMRSAMGFGLRMLAGGAACLVHALVPVFFVNTGSRTVQELHVRMGGKRGTRPLPPGTPIDFVI